MQPVSTHEEVLLWMRFSFLKVATIGIFALIALVLVLLLFHRPALRVR